MDILAFPSNVAKIGGEINHHGENITKEIIIMHSILDKQGSDICREIHANGNNITKEMENMRMSFETEMKDLKQKTRNICITMMVVNVVSRIVFR